MKRLFIYIFVGLALGISLQQCVDYIADAELIFFNKVADKSEQWFKTASKNTSDTVHVIIGGSEIASSVNPLAMREKHGLTVINAGNHAGFGLPGNAIAAEQFITTGNHIVCSLYSSTNVTSQGIKFAFRRKGFRLFETGLIPLNASNLLKLLSGDLSSNINYVKRKRKKRAHIHAYEYPEMANLHDTGFLEIINDGMQKKSVPGKDKVDQHPEDITAFCEKMKSLCQKRGATFSVMFALHYNTIDTRIQHAELALHLTAKGIPVLKDERLGISDDISDFADTPSHLSAKGVDSCTNIWGKALKNRLYWTPQELIEQINSIKQKQHYTP